MADIIRERIRLEDKDTGAFRHLDTAEGLRAQADVAANIVSRMGYYDSDARSGEITEAEAAIRRDTLLEIATDLGLGLVVKVIYEEPIPPENGRHIEIPDEVREFEQAAAQQVAITAKLDGKEVSSDFHHLGSFLRAKPGQGLDEVFEDWERN